ncbi:LytTR family DNA-binding domain-containing protein [uncultured Sphingomonas sp.]|uniref:LytTR family DNA-binding domain-containing protein n=1 Tax=uncultured Sphingomonas sp. TaxID=158754 RepID=UPI0035CC83F1
MVAWALAGMAASEMRLAALAGLYPQVLLVGLLVTAAQVALGRARATGPGAAAAPPVAVPDGVQPGADPSPAPPRFLDRLPPAIGSDLIALEQEDHYLRVHTALGSALILMRMRDAADELAAVDGARIHRSWWVARDAVAAVIRRDRAVALRLVNGLEAPVARAAAPALRARGWL